jgi:hypothetical protein
MKLSIQAGSTSQTINVFIQDSSSTTGAGLAGLVYGSSGLTAYYALPKAAAAAITLATLAAITTAWSSGGFKEIDATNMPGWYRLDIPDAALASGRFVSIHLQGATNMAPLPIEIELTGWNNQDAVHGGMTALPNVAAGISGGMPLAADTSGRVDVLKVNGTSQTARDLGASVLLSPGTGTGQLSLASGLVTLAAVTHTGARIPNVTLADTVTTYTGDTPQTGDGYARMGAAGAGLTALGDTRIANLDAAISSRTKPADTQAAVTTVTNLTNAPTAGDLTATMKTSVTTAATAATPTVTAGTVSDKTGYALATAPPTAAAIGVAVVDQTMSGHTTGGTVGGALNAAGSAGDPWSTPLPGAYSAGSAGNIVGTRLDAAVSGVAAAVWAVSVRTLSSFGTLVADAATAVWAAATRTLSAFAFTVTAATVSDKTGYALATAPPTAAAIRTEMDSNSTKLAYLDATTSSRSTYAGGAVASVTAPVTAGTVSDKAGYSLATPPPTAIQNADALLTRDWTAVSGEAARSVLNALRFLRNKWSVAAGTLTVTKEDDTAAAWTGTVTTDAAALPITGSDPT